MTFLNFLLIFNINIFFFIQILNFKMATNQVEKLYLLYYYSINQKWKYYYNYNYPTLILILDVIIFNKISFFLLVLTIFSYFKKIIEDKKINMIKLKATRTKIKSPEDIVDIYYLNILYSFQIQNIKDNLKNKKEFIFLQEYIYYIIIVLDYFSLIKYN